MKPRVNPDGSVRQGQGGGSRYPVRRVIRRIQVDGDQRGEVHITLCEHALNDRPPRLYLHLHTFVRRAQDIRKPVAFNAHQLGLLIAQLYQLQNEMEAGTSAHPADAPDTGEPPRRVRGRRADRGDEPTEGRQIVSNQELNRATSEMISAGREVIRKERDANSPEITASDLAVLVYAVMERVRIQSEEYPE